MEQQLDKSYFIEQIRKGGDLYLIFMSKARELLSLRSSISIEGAKSINRLIRIANVYKRSDTERIEMFVDYLFRSDLEKQSEIEKWI